MNKKLFFLISIVTIGNSAVTSNNLTIRNSYKPSVARQRYSQQRDTTKPDITNPGPDTANFPMSPYTLPQGRVYWENFPIYFDIHKNRETHTYYWPYLLRIGLTDRLELRFSGQGITSTHRNLGFWPLEIGFKVHIWGTPDTRWIPSFGIESSIITEIASKKFRNGTQFGINALFFQTFTKRLSLEWNVGTYSVSVQKSRERKFIALINWALEYDISENIGLFFEGQYNSRQYPKYPDSFLLGAGFISTLTQRICIFGSYNWQVLNHGNDNANLGFAVAF